MGRAGCSRVFLALLVTTLWGGACDGGGGPSGGGPADAGGVDASAGDLAGPSDVPDEPGADALAASETADDALRHDAGPDVPIEPPGTVRFVHISDLHVRGTPENPSSVHLARAFEQLNAVDFPADFVVATGDFVEWLPEGLTAESPSNLRIALEELAALRWPVRTTAGNHEYYRDGSLQPTVDKEGRDALLAAVLGHPLDEAYVDSGVRTVVMNSSEGDLWLPNAGLVGSYTDPQLAWLRAQLADGRPTLLFTHHPPAPGITTTGGDSLCAALEEHPGVVKAIFAGHLHGFWKGDYCGVPYYLVSNVVPGKVFYYLVEYDGAQDVLTLVNEAELPFPDLPELTCDPLAGGFEDPGAAVGSHQVLRVGSMVTNLPGLEGFDGRELDASPFVLHPDEWDAATGTLRARFTMARASVTNFVGPLDGAPCLALDLDVSGPCVVSGSQAFELDVAPLVGSLLNEWIDPAWHIRFDIESLWFEGRMGTDAEGAPVVEDGLLHLSGTGTRALDDLRGILVAEYCAGAIAACQPGSSAQLPACDGSEDATFFDRIPTSCDTTIGSLPLRFVITFMGSYPLENVILVGQFRTESRPTSPTSRAGAVDETLFTTGSCAP